MCGVRENYGETREVMVCCGLCGCSGGYGYGEYLPNQRERASNNNSISCKASGRRKEIRERDGLNTSLFLCTTLEIRVKYGFKVLSRREDLVIIAPIHHTDHRACTDHRALKWDL